MLKLPLVVQSSAEVFVCRTVERAEQELEPPDVKNGEYTGYDRDGRLLRFKVVTKEVPILFGLSTSLIERVKIEAAEEEPTHAGELRSAVLSYLDRIGFSTRGMERISLSELLQEAIAHLDVY